MLKVDGVLFFHRKTLKKFQKIAKINHLNAERGTRNAEMRIWLANPRRPGEGDTSIWCNLVQVVLSGSNMVPLTVSFGWWRLVRSFFSFRPFLSPLAEHLITLTELFKKYFFERILDWQTCLPVGKRRHVAALQSRLCLFGGGDVK